MLLDAGFISGQFGEERPVYLVIGNPYRKRFYLIVDSGGDLFSSFIPRHFPVFLSGITLGTSWLPMLFAVFLNEIRCIPFRKFVQTVTTLPNFISWVLVYSLAFSLFNSTGMFNTLLLNLGLIKEPVLLLQSSEHVWLTQWLWLTWKNLGWAAIMYIAAISSIDDELFQAAKVDGATRMQMIRYITIPSLLPTFFVLLMMNIGNFLSNGMEQYYVFQNAFNKDYMAYAITYRCWICMSIIWQWEAAVIPCRLP